MSNNIKKEDKSNQSTQKMCRKLIMTVDLNSDLNIVKRPYYTMFPCSIDTYNKQRKAELWIKQWTRANQKIIY